MAVRFAAMCYSDVTTSDESAGTRKPFSRSAREVRGGRAAEQRGDRRDGAGQLLQRVAEQGLRAVAEGRLGVRMDVHHHAVGPGGNAGAGERDHEVTAAGRV